MLLNELETVLSQSTTVDIIYGDLPENLTQLIEDRHLDRTAKSVIFSDYGYVGKPVHSFRWDLLKYPIVEVSSELESDVIRFNGEYKSPVFVDLGSLAGRATSLDYWRQQKFTASLKHYGSSELLQLRYNPAASLNTAYRREVAAYDELMRGFFHYEDMCTLINAVQAHQWPIPEKSPFCGLHQNLHSNGPREGAYRPVRNQYRFSRYQLTTLSNADAADRCGRLAMQFFMNLDLGKLLVGNSRPKLVWWREGSKGHGDTSWKQAIINMMPYLYGVERICLRWYATAKAETAREAERAKNSEEPWNVEGWRERLPGRVLALSRLCRFLRKEIKALELGKVPIPVSPKKKSLPKKKPKKRKFRLKASKRKKK